MSVVWQSAAAATGTGEPVCAVGMKGVVHFFHLSCGVLRGTLPVCSDLSKNTWKL